MKMLFLVCAILFPLFGCSGDGTKNGEPLATAGNAPSSLASQPPSQLRILVIGGSSGTGLEVVKLALARGHDVTAMSRHPERMTLSHENLQVIKGDVLDAQAVNTAVTDKDVIVNAIGIGPTRDPVTVFSEGIKNVLESMQTAEVNRLVAVTGIGAGDSLGHGGFFYDRIVQPLALKTVYVDKDREERLIAASAVDWTIVRPGTLTDKPAETRYRVIQNLEGVVAGRISRADVAHFIVAILEAGSYTRATVMLSN